MVDYDGTGPTATTNALSFDRHFSRVVDRETWRFWIGSKSSSISCNDQQKSRANRRNSIVLDRRMHQLERGTKRKQQDGNL